MEQLPAEPMTTKTGCGYRVISLFLALLLLCSPLTFILQVTPQPFRGRLFSPIATWRVQREVQALTQTNPSLHELRLDGRNINTLPPEISTFTSLETLSITNNHLTTLPSAIGQLYELKELHLAHNELQTLPADIAQLEQLQLLDLSDNDLVELPPEIGRLTDLRVLKLNNNCNLTALPIQLAFLTNLEHLSLQGTRLTLYDIPQPLRESAKLTILYDANPYACPPQQEPNPVAFTGQRKLVGS